MNQKKSRSEKGLWRLLAFVLTFALMINMMPPKLLIVKAEGSTLVTDGGKITWDFTNGSSPVYASGVDGSLSVQGTFTYDESKSQHGATIGNDTVFSIEVPAGQTTLTFGVCTYGSSTAVIRAGETVLQDAFSLNGGQVEPDGQEAVVQYTSETDSTITVTVTGNGFIHSISAETTTPPQVASVQGTVADESGSAGGADGQTLIFADENGQTTETEIAEGIFAVSLPVGHTYTVSFANSNVYEITSGNTIDLDGTENGAAVTNDIIYRIIWDTAKTFSFSISDTTYTVTPGASSSEDFIVTAEGGNGSVELVTTDTAIIWADLNGAGQGTLMSNTLENVSDNVTYELSGNTITFTYEDSATSPTEFTIQVKDNSASGTPHANGRTVTYDLGDGSIVSELYTGNYSITDGASVPSADGLVTVIGNNRVRYNDGAHGIMVGNGDQISVKVAGNAEIAFELCAYSADGSTLNAAVSETESSEPGSLEPGSVSAKAENDGDTAAFTYTGDEATLTFTYNGSSSGYIHSLAVTNELPETEITTQEAMPEVREYGNVESMTVSPVGQRLTLTQKGGSLPTGAALSDNVGYYGFDPTIDFNRLEADVRVESCGNSSSNGVFFGAFDGTNIKTIAIRNSTNLRGVYSDEEAEISAGKVNESILEGQVVHFTAEKAGDGFVITATPEGGETYTLESSVGPFAEGMEDDEISFGFILAGASVTVTNMKYYDKNDNLLYDQNNCYEAIGTAPVVNSVQAVTADTRDSIIITWNSSELADGDGRYVIQVKKDNGDWEDVAETTDTSWTYMASEAGTYEFRVGGKLGSEGKVTYCENTATVTDFLPALPAPVVTLNADSDSIDISWTASEGATAYEVYRYSSDEGPENSKMIYEADAAETSWTDTGVDPEVPYYYYVIAYQYGDTSSEAINSSNPSETVWAMASSGHTGDYVYEDEAAAITITECPDETVFQNTVSIGGTVDRSGMLSMNVNGTETEKQDMTPDGTFSFNCSLQQGRNEIALIFTDTKGMATRETFNVVYLTNYDMVVDASYSGEDGAAVDGLPTYSTVQAAVDSVPADNTERQVIYIKTGDYNERLVVASPNISLAGEKQDGVRIHCYPAALHPGDSTYEAGGDMSNRCATYIMATATGFSAENITFANDYDYSTPDGKSNKSADALRCDADGATFVNVTISGVQDTLYMNSGNQYYYQCRIEGLIDFIYSGDAARALFEDCEIVFVYEETHPEGGYVCAPRTAPDAPYGLIFNNCVITSEEGCKDGTFHLARPWGPNACIYWIDCYMGAAINAKNPYADMSGNLYTEARFYECGSYGPGYAVNGDRRQISPAGAESLLAGLGWDPDSTMQTVNDAYIGEIIDPTPEEPTPEDPTPEEPTPEEPTPEDPTPEEPTPEEPTPEEPAPEEPAPEEPTPEVPKQGLQYDDASGDWYVYKDGKRDTTYTSVVQNENGWWYVKNGVLDWDYTGVAQNEYGWWYINHGALDWNYTGVAQNEYGWWYINHGAVDWTYTGVAQNEYGWWYINHGALDWNYTGVAQNEYGWWYINHGAVDWTYTGVAQNEYGWWYINDGWLNWDYTGVAQNEYGWWYINHGAVDWTYTGVAQNEYGWWYINDGWLNWNYNGIVAYKGRSYFVVDGCVIH